MFRIIILYSKYVVHDRFIFDFANTPCGIYSIPKVSKYRVVYLLINNEIQCVPFVLFVNETYKIPSIFYSRYIISQKSPVRLGSKLKYLVILILVKRWSKTKKNLTICFLSYILFYPCDSFSQNIHH